MLKKLQSIFYNKQVRLRFMMAIAVLMIGSGNGYGQAGSVTGTVTDASNKEGLPGVSILLKGTQRGANTDSKGNFEMSNLPAKAVLIFSYIGYKKTEVEVNGKSQIKVSLEEDVNNLEETIVVGFGTQKKINVAGAVDQISGKQLEARPIANVMQGLQGISPGLNITYGGGQPGTVPVINIRGFTSINGGSPLIVIDGIPASDSYDLLRLNPADVASFTVLRDAASAAIYGARAAFGVILITTKQGGQGRQSISYNSYASWGRPTVLPRPVTDPYIFSRVLETNAPITLHFPTHA
jgi:TonB-dependent SusC/RagA subfamily outer membrane receptor